MARRGASAQDSADGGANSSADKTVKLRRSARNLHKTGGESPHSDASVRNRSSSRGGALAREEPTSGPGNSSSGPTPVAGPSSASHAVPVTVTADPVTPDKSNITVPVVQFDFTPATGTQMEYAYQMADRKDRTRKAVYEANRQRAEGQCVVTPNIEDWLLQCLPTSTNTPERSPEAWKTSSLKLFTTKNVPNTHNEAKFYDAIVKSGVFKYLTPKDTHVIRGEDVNDPSQKYSPDFSSCRSDVRIDKPGVERTRTILQQTDGNGDLKADDEDPTKDTPKGRQSFGQLATYVHVTSTNSHRTRMYSFCLTPTKGYLFLFDQSAIIRSSAFNWRESGHLLSFLSRYDAMSAAERGWDSSVKLIAPTHPDAERAKVLLKTRRKLLRGALPKGITPSMVFPAGKYGDLSLFYIYDSETRVVHRVVAHRPYDCDTSGYLGAGTRWWIGIDLDLGRVVFFKSYWRIDRPDIPSESDIHRQLRGFVENTLEFAYGGDVLDNAEALWEHHRNAPIPPEDSRTFQRTISHDLIEKNKRLWDRPQSDRGRKKEEAIEIVPRVHHISVFFTVVRKLHTFKTPQELVRVLYHATQAIQQAHDKGILHRNLTASSIGIDNRGNGRVLNWDWTALVIIFLKFARTRSRPISLQFAAADLLRYPSARRHLLRDDLESIVHILWFHALRYLPITPNGKITRNTVLHGMRSIFEESAATADNEIEAGATKASFLGGRHTLNDDTLGGGAVKPAPMWSLMRSFRNLYQPLYEVEPAVDEDLEADERAEAEELKTEWKLARSKAVELLTSAKPLLDRFEAALAKTWPQFTVVPVDQYAPTTLPSTGLSSFTGNAANSSARTSIKRSYVPGPNNLPEAKRHKSSSDDVFGSTSARSVREGDDEGSSDDEDAEVEDEATEEEIFSLQAH